jgi:hypothetical protein
MSWWFPRKIFDNHDDHGDHECILKKLKCFFYNTSNTANQAKNNTKQEMAMNVNANTGVNPNLESLMRVIEENQGKMSEGEYLEAMNALCALHREHEQHRQQQARAPAVVGSIPIGRPPSYAASVPLFASSVRVLPPGMEGNLTEQRAWERVKNYHPDPFQNRISAEEWMLMTYENRFRLVREATDHYASKQESLHCTPDPKVCPFITRHAVGCWSMEDNGETKWECVCGYTGKVKNWKKHEQSERHQEWARHRTVSRRKIEKMKAMINDDEAGNFIRFACYAPNPRGLYPGGIRIYTVWQDKNEWTNPEMFDDIHRNPVPVVHLDEHGNVGDTTTTWFVHRRNIWARQYVQ